MFPIQIDAFSKDCRLELDLQEGEILYLIKSFYASAEANLVFSQLRDQLAWTEEEIHLFGKRQKVPRLMCWYGDAGANYRYSGVDHAPLPWFPDLLWIKDKIEQATGYRFNSVLANLYREGRDSMGWHSDDEAELGKNPSIASLSFGEERIFKLRHKKRKQVYDILLGHGDLLVMAGTFQQHWLHSLPKSHAPKSERINLTFRHIFVPV